MGAVVLNAWGLTFGGAGRNLGQAQELFEQSLALYKEIDERSERDFVFINLGCVAE